MPSFRFLALAAVAAALVVVAPAIGDSGAARKSAVPPAEAAGGDAVPLIPSIVNTRLVRAQAALENATGDVDSGQPAQAVASMGAAVDNLTKGWNAEKWLIQTAPPPPPADDAISDGDGAAIAYATPEDTAVAVFSAQHNLVSTAVGMMETANAALLTSLTKSITTVGNSRTAAINYIHSIAPPPPADDAVGDGLEGVATWDTVMPTTVAFLDDEIQQITGRLALYKFSASAKAALQKALGRAQTAKALVNQYWPPVLDD
jgi:hypothetical protein